MVTGGANMTAVIRNTVAFGGLSTAEFTSEKVL